MEEQYYTIIIRHDESTQWLINNPVLALGEYGVEDDTHKVKRGDGITPWENLAYETFGISELLTFETLKGNILDNQDLKVVLDSKIDGSYDNSKSGLEAVTIQKAIDELSTKIDKLNEQKN